MPTPTERASGSRRSAEPRFEIISVLFFGAVYFWRRSSSSNALLFGEASRTSPRQAEQRHDALLRPLRV